MCLVLPNAVTNYSLYFEGITLKYRDMGLIKGRQIMRESFLNRAPSIHEYLIMSQEDADS